MTSSHGDRCARRGASGPPAAEWIPWRRTLALGLTAFYYALTPVVVGMLSANVISGQVDHALGYTHNDMGPVRRHRPLIRATRVQTLAISSTLMAGLSLLMGTVVMAGAIDLMGMGAFYLPLLWLYSVCAVAVTGIGALALLAVRSCRSPAAR
ncbi:hypothetical protein [Streptomyces cellulosae]|uniref:Uncharacterized protein n=1 Tax=Streptomyces cellulosae TaxID=1968 RepID=A0ABW7Y1Y5_STRCE